MRKALFLTALVLHATAAFAAGRELSTPRDVPHSVESATIASNGHGFLGAWFQQGSTTIDLMPYGADGRPLRSRTLALHVQQYSHLLDITADGDRYVVATSLLDGRTQLAILSDQGELIDRLTFRVDALVDVRIIAADGHILMVGRSFTGQRLGVSACFTDDKGSRFTCSLIDGAREVPYSMARTDDGFVVAVGGLNGAVYRFDLDGNRLGAPVRLPTYYTRLDVNSHGSEILVAGTDGSSRLLATFIPSQGTVRESTLARVALSVLSPRVVFAGGAFHIVFNEAPDRFPYTPARIWTASFLGNSNTAEPALLYGDESPLLLQDTASNGDVIVAVTKGPYESSFESAVKTITWPASNPTAKRIDAVMRPAGQRFPAIASDGTNVFAAWYEDPGRVRAARVSADGHSLDSSNERIEFTGWAPAVAFGANTYLLTFVQMGRIFGVRVRDDGSVLDRQPFAISAEGGYATFQAIAWNGSYFSVVWAEYDREIDSAAVSLDGSVIQRRRISPEWQPGFPGLTTRFHRPRIAVGDGGQSVVAYQVTSTMSGADVIPAPVIESHIEAIALDPFGDVVSSPAHVGPAFLNAITHGPDNQFLVSFSDNTGVSSSVVYQVDDVLIPALPVKMLDWPGGAETAVTWNGSEYVAVVKYEPPYNYSDRGWTGTRPVPSYLALARLDARGTRKSLTVAASGTSDYEQSHAVTTTATGFIALASEMRDCLRIIAYSSGDFETPPPIPLPPTNVLAIEQSPSSETLAWSPAPGVIDGYVIEQEGFVPAVVPPDQHTFTTEHSFLSNPSVRSFNAAGFSEPAIAARHAPRRRATSH